MQAGDEWSALEAVVRLELLMEARGLLIEHGTANRFPSSVSARATAGAG
jgi:hypothetical protein